MRLVILVVTSRTLQMAVRLNMKAMEAAAAAATVTLASLGRLRLWLSIRKFSLASVAIFIHSSCLQSTLIHRHQDLQQVIWKCFLDGELEPAHWQVHVTAQATSSGPLLKSEQADSDSAPQRLH